jgi:hypothetical protein
MKIFVYVFFSVNLDPDPDLYSDPDPDLTRAASPSETARRLYESRAGKLPQTRCILPMF